MKSHKKIIFGLVLFVAVLSILFIYMGLFDKKPITYIPKEVKINGVFLGESKTIQDFQLTDHKGRPFSKNNLMGHWTMMFFGFTNCGYVCPTTMTELNKMYHTLKLELPHDKLPQIVLVTVDPERDSMTKMNDYINAFNADFIGARTEIKETEAFEKQLHVMAVKIEADDKAKDQYMVNHSAEILLFNPKGEVQAYLSFPHKTDQLVKDYKTILATEIS
jgi:protein SCO1/2